MKLAYMKNVFTEVL